MPYQELEQFLGRGEEKAVWVLSYKNILGLVLGGLVGQRLGLVAGGQGLAPVLVGCAGALIGVLLTMQLHGIVVGRRLLIRLRFYLGRAVRPRVIDAALCYTAAAPPAPLLQLRTMDGTPLVEQRPARTALARDPEEELACR